MSEHRAKYATRNPIARRLVERFVAGVVGRVRALDPGEVIDLGCGEGFVASRLVEALPGVRVRGFDRDPAAIVAAEARCPEGHFAVADVLDLEPEASEGGRVVICLEVLEHLAHPDALVERIAGWAEGGVALASVPWEPWFQLGSLLRGRHLARLGNHPDHRQRFRPASFRALLLESFDVVEVETLFPWLLATSH